MRSGLAVLLHGLLDTTSDAAIRRALWKNIDEKLMLATTDSIVGLELAGHEGLANRLEKQVDKARDAIRSEPYRLQSDSNAEDRTFDQLHAASALVDAIDRRLASMEAQAKVSVVSQPPSSLPEPYAVRAGNEGIGDGDADDEVPSLTKSEVAVSRDALIHRFVEALNGGTAAGDSSSSPPTSSDRPGTGMPIEKVIKLAEAHVKAHRGVYPGRNKLAKIIGCSTYSITKAIKRSVYLKARKAEHDAAKRGTNRERQSSQPLDELTYDKDWKTGDDDRDATLDKLISEQNADMRREETQRKRARRHHEDD